MHYFEKKIFDEESLPFELLDQWKVAGEKLVFTNGCFDLLHRGHIHYLSSAAKLGDRLIVGLNSDDSVKRLKGSTRPVKDQKNRAEILAALQMVDLVLVFHEDTPFRLIEKVMPDILVKGGDWPIENIVGAKLVKANKGKVISLEFIPGESSSDMIHKIRATKENKDQQPTTNN